MFSTTLEMKAKKEKLLRFNKRYTISVYGKYAIREKKLLF